MKDYFHRMNHPTVMQIRFMEELEKTPVRRGAVTAIAQRCGVDHASVSRFFKSCRDAGYLTESLEITEDGMIWIHAYQRLRQGLRSYLAEQGAPVHSLEDNVSVMIENMDYHTLSMLVSNFQNRSVSESEFSDSRRKSRINLASLLNKSSYSIHFRILRIDYNGESSHALSMADGAFQKPAVLRNYKRGIWLELTLKEIRAWSRVKEAWMTGRLADLKYEQYGLIRQAKIQNDTVKIPLEDCYAELYDDNKIYGVIPITVTSDVGTQHMPESSALLVFWL
ncbi:MAG: hypothetical protein IJI10_10700 [Eubacterium sp.]|nr:hypothetical protein [Eubacterium sp.]